MEKKKRKDTCTLRFTAALYTIAKIRRQPKCPSTQILYHGATKEALQWNITPHKKATRIDLETIILTEVRQRKTSIIRYHLYVESKQMNLFTKWKQTHRVRDKRTVTTGEGWRGAGRHSQTVGINIYTLLYIQNSQQGPTVITYMWKKSEKKICMHVTKPLCCTPEKQYF